ncbi:unnamed protein product [Rhodiola kirilowii]
MQMFRPSNECYEQSNNYQSSMKPFAKPAGYGGNSLAQCQTQTQCFETQLHGKPNYAAGGGYGMQHAAGAQGYGNAFPQKPLGQYSQQGSYSSVQHGGHGSALPGSFGSVQHGGHGSTHHASHGAYGSAHHGSFGSGCEAQSGGYNYTMKKKERRSWRKRSGNDSDSSGSDESDNEKC